MTGELIQRDAGCRGTEVRRSLKYTGPWKTTTFGSTGTLDLTISLDTTAKTVKVVTDDHRQSVRLTAAADGKR